jgi:hypothetical protein
VQGKGTLSFVSPFLFAVSSMKSISSFASKFEKSGVEIHVLVQNAGVLVSCAAFTLAHRCRVVPTVFGRHINASPMHKKIYAAVFVCLPLCGRSTSPSNLRTDSI